MKRDAGVLGEALGLKSTWISVAIIATIIFRTYMWYG
jgi:hypothetical protein